MGHHVQADNGCCYKKLARIPPSALKPSQPAALENLKPLSGSSATPELLCGCVLLRAKHALRTVSELTGCDVKMLAGKIFSCSF